jgi:hypothetical protein
MLVKRTGMSLMVCGMVFAYSFVFAEEERHTLPPQLSGGGSEMAQYYLGRHYKYAMFPGRLVCLRCDTMPTPENIEVCRKEGQCR